MNKIKKSIEEADSYKKIDKMSLENKTIKQSLDLNVNLDLIDNYNAYYSKRSGWTLRQN